MVDCKKIERMNRMGIPTFQQWKEHIKHREQKFWRVVNEDHQSIELTHRRFTHYRARSHMCEMLTNELHQKGITQSFIASYQGFENEKKITLIYYLFFIHKGHLLTADLLVMQNEQWKPLEVDIRHAGPHWESLERYEEELNDVKELFLDVVTQDPAIRLYVVTGLVKEG